MSVYSGNFENWADVVSNFSCAVPEPDQVLYANYDTPDYEGYAEVVYRNGDRFFIVGGSHCSCHGLEGQWSPEEFDRDTFAAYLGRQRDDHYKAIAAAI